MTQEMLKQAGTDESGRRSLSGGGVLALDERLPFLLVHRQPPSREDAATDRLIAGEASFLAARQGGEEEARALVRGIAEAGSTAHGAFLVLEIWSAADAACRRFTLRAPAGPAPETTEKLLRALESLRTLRPELDVHLETSDERHPPDLPPLFSIAESWQHEILVLGLEVPPIYRDPESGAVYPRFVRRLQRAFSRAVRQALYEFVRVQTTAEVTHHLALGTRTLPDAVWQVDRALCAIEHAFDMLLLVSPVNASAARERFEADGYARRPELHYRLLPMDPDLLKRRLFAIEMEAIDDPALADLFQDKRDELDTQLTMLGERESPRFRYSSQRLYGTVTDELHAVALDLLAHVPPPRGRVGATVDARAFRDAALRELAHYRQRYPTLATRVEVRPDVTGLMVSSGNLLIGAELSLDPARVEPLLHHEVGTHVLTYVNGLAQPLEQLSLGLAAYDELQEGLAVLAEYLVGGLDRLRMRLLAARVVAARTVENGADFVDTFRVLTRDHGYSAGGAWHITLRVHQSGGFTRDLIYLRGLIDLLRLLQDGGDIEPLYLGKIAQKHIRIVEELRHRRILREPPLTPRFLDDPAAGERLARLRHGISLTEMICPANER
jgi:uncharacterized protein (TIGR02421 family)